MRKFFSLFLIMALAFSCAVAPAFADSLPVASAGKSEAVAQEVVLKASSGQILLTVVVVVLSAAILLTQAYLIELLRSTGLIVMKIHPEAAKKAGKPKQGKAPGVAAKSAASEIKKKPAAKKKDQEKTPA